MKKILVVSNNESFFKETKGILNRAVFRVFRATAGKEALNVHREKNTDLIITELEMTEMSGDELCFNIRKDTELSKVSLIIVCTNSKPEVERCKKSVANLCMTKPIDPDLLVKEAFRLLKIPARKSFRIPINDSVTGDYMLRSFLCKAQNISISGIMLETNRVLHKGEKISCFFCLSNSKQIIAKGKVVRVLRKTGDIYQYGVNFLNLSNDSRAVITDFIKKRSQKKEDIPGSPALNAIDIDKLNEVLKTIRDSLGQLYLTTNNSKELEVKIAALESQASAPKSRILIAREYLRSIRSILEQIDNLFIK
jgi:CheY-like chemotaxis protein